MCMCPVHTEIVPYREKKNRVVLPIYIYTLFTTTRHVQIKDCLSLTTNILIVIVFLLIIHMHLYIISTVMWRCHKTCS